MTAISPVSRGYPSVLVINTQTVFDLHPDNLNRELTKRHFIYL